MMINALQLIKDISKIDLEDICSDWQWCLQDQQTVILVSAIGDMFLLGKNGSINWLETGTGQLKKIANDIKEFELLLNDEENVDNWFLPGLVEDLITNGKVLNENQVYSFKTMPGIGGDYSIDNFETT